MYNNVERFNSNRQPFREHSKLILFQIHVKWESHMGFFYFLLCGIQIRICEKCQLMPEKYSQALSCTYQCHLMRSNLLFIVISYGQACKRHFLEQPCHTFPTTVNPESQNLATTRKTPSQRSPTSPCLGPPNKISQKSTAEQFKKNIAKRPFQTSTKCQL